MNKPLALETLPHYRKHSPGILQQFQHICRQHHSFAIISTISLSYLCNHSYLSCLTTQCFAARKETADKEHSADWDIIETSPFTNAFNKRKAMLFSRLFVRPKSRRSRDTLSVQNLKLARNIDQPCSDTCRY